MIGRELLSFLSDNEYKYTEEDIIFIARNEKGRIVWLEKGNDNAGLSHIILGHKEDFKRAFNVDEDKIAGFLYEVVVKGTIIKEYPSKNGTGIDTIYDYNGRYFTFIGTGSNGYIVTAFPTD